MDDGRQGQKGRVGTFWTLAALANPLCHVKEPLVDLKNGVPKGRVQRAALHRSLRTLGECLPEDHRTARVTGPQPRRILFFASKALLCVSFQLNTPVSSVALATLVSTFPGCLCRKQMGAKLVPWMWEMRTHDVVGGRKVLLRNSFCTVTY